MVRFTYLCPNGLKMTCVAGAQWGVFWQIITQVNGALHLLMSKRASPWPGPKPAPANYNLALNNCEVFATICRCMRCAPSCHNALDAQLAVMPAFPPAPLIRGFK